ncbi:MAG TPA: hypothetical protein DD435_09140 [Cyanobacteria bacterium UBA8530]|nr:hypothetical protein [Cyanobacteria bacterium UBA8530]
MIHWNSLRLLALIAILATGCSAPLSTPLGQSSMPKSFRALGGEGDFPASTAPKSLTFLSYQAVNNNLQGSLAPDLNAFERAIDPATTNILVQADTLNLSFSLKEGFKNVGHANKNRGYRFFVRPDEQESFLSSYQDFADPNSGDGRTLQDFISLFASYPSRLQVLDIRSHGHGPLGIADDYKSRSNIALPDLQAAIQLGLNGKKLDVLTTKACLMATIEVGYQLSKNVRFLVASENGMTSRSNQDSLLYRSLDKVDEETSPREFALRYAREGMALQSDARRTVSTLSVLDLEKTEAIAAGMAEVTKDLLLLLPSRKTEVAQIFANCRNWGRAQTQSDLYDLVDKLEKLGDKKLSSDCERVKSAILPAVAFNLTDEKNRVGAHGLTILTQLNSGDPALDKAGIERYRNTAFDRKVGWSKVLEFTGISGPERKDNLG